MVPEVAGLSVEEIDKVFEGPWYNAWRVTRNPDSPAGDVEAIDGEDGKQDNIVNQR